MSQQGGPLTVRVFTSPSHGFGDRGQTFSPTTSTLIVGKRDAVLIDTQFVADDVRALGDLIEASGRHLTAIYVTHGHADHYFGLTHLTRRFPGARPVATASVVADIEANGDAGAAWFRGLFGDVIVAPPAAPDPLAGSALDLEGHEIRIIEVGQSDTAPSTVVHVPALDTVVAGDVAYNRIHPMLAFTDADQARAWIRSIDAIEALKPATVVAGHKDPHASDTDIATILDGTRDYIEDFLGTVAGGGGAREIIETMTAKYPEYGNHTTLVASASAFARRVLPRPQRAAIDAVQAAALPGRPATNS